MPTYIITETAKITFVIQADSEEAAFIKIDELNLGDRKEIAEFIRLEVTDIETL
jgi:hypothetical protein